VLRHPALPQVCAELVAMARGKFAEAERAMADCPRRPMRPAALMKAMYQPILGRLERRGWTALDQPVKTPRALKLWLVVRHGLI
jgi:phytoene/squalene synthetase